MPDVGKETNAATKMQKDALKNLCVKKASGYDKSRT